MSMVIRNLEEAKRIVECFLNAPMLRFKLVLLEKDECSIEFATPVVSYEFKSLRTMWSLFGWLSRRMEAYTEIYYELPKAEWKMSKSEVLKWARKNLDEKSYTRLRKWIKDKDGEMWVTWDKVVTFFDEYDKYIGLSDEISIVLTQCGDQHDSF